MEHKIMNKKKQSLGRRKIEIKKIEDKSSRQVTFSKRRSGLFRKASELCILTGAEAAIFVLSPKGKVFTLGHPSVDAIIDRYEHVNEELTITSSHGFDYGKLHEQMRKLRVLEGERDRVKEKTEMNGRSGGGGNGGGGDGENGFWWRRKIDGMELNELEKFRDGLEELRNKVNMKADEMAMVRRSQQFMFA